MNNDLEKLPKISYLMVTCGRIAFIKRSIQCYCDQTYSNRELIIISNEKPAIIKAIYDCIASFGDRSDIKFKVLADKKYTLGELRNQSIEEAQGTIVCIWDDDDYSHSNRLLFQMTMIIKFNLDGCTLQREQLWFAAKQKFAYSNRRLWEGAMVCKNEKLPAYHERVRGEETDAITHLALTGTIAILDFPALYTYCFHGKNTFDELHFEQIWQMASFHFPDKSYKNKVQSLDQHFD